MSSLKSDSLSHTLDQVASGTAIAQALGPGATAVVNYGIESEKVAELLEAAGTAAQGKITELSHQITESQSTIRHFLLQLNQDGLEIDEVAEALTQIAEKHLEMLQTLGPIEAFVEERSGWFSSEFQKSTDLEMLKAGTKRERVEADLELGREAEAVAEKATRIEYFLEKAKFALKSTELRRGKINELRGDLRLKDAYRSAAVGLFRKAARLYDDTLPALVDVDKKALTVLFEDDDDHSLVLAAEVLKEMELAYIRYAFPKGSADGQVGVLRQKRGQALLRLAERKDDADLLRQAIVQFESALEMRRVEADSKKMAETRAALGHAQILLAEETDDLELMRRGAEALQESVDELFLSRPDDWADGQRALGRTLTRLGVSHKDPQLMLNGASALRKVLKDYGKARNPDFWANCQFLLGEALYRLNRQEYKREAIEAYRQALTVSSAGTIYGTILFSLSWTLADLGEMEKDAQLLKEALKALNLARGAFLGGEEEIALVDQLRSRIEKIMTDQL